MNLQENIQRIKEMMGVTNEGLHDTSWENEEGDKITLIDLLNATEDIPVKKISLNKIKSKLLTWDEDEDEVKKIESANLKYPILIFVDDNNKFISSCISFLNCRSRSKILITTGITFSSFANELIILDLTTSSGNPELMIDFNSCTFIRCFF